MGLNRAGLLEVPAPEGVVLTVMQLLLRQRRILPLAFDMAEEERWR